MIRFVHCDRLLAAAANAYQNLNIPLKRGVCILDCFESQFTTAVLAMCRGRWFNDRAHDAF